MTNVTRILKAVEQGHQQAADELLLIVYDELRRLAAQRLSQEAPGQTLQATALVHEAYIRLVDVEKAQHLNSRGHFFGAAAEAMRRILVDISRSKSRRIRRGDNAFLRNGSSIHESNTNGYQTSYVFHLENPVRFTKEIKVSSMATAITWPTRCRAWPTSIWTGPRGLRCRPVWVSACPCCATTRVTGYTKGRTNLRANPLRKMLRCGGSRPNGQESLPVDRQMVNEQTIRTG